ncbi:MAG: macro domain-containing protein [Rhodocyclaceae bacterium]
MSLTLCHGDIWLDGADAVVVPVPAWDDESSPSAMEMVGPYTGAYAQYRMTAQAGLIVPGRLLWTSTGRLHPSMVAFMPVDRPKDGAEDAGSIRDALRLLVRDATEMGLRSVALPPPGCGDGALSWMKVTAMVTDAVRDAPEVDWRLYTPRYALR